MLSNMKLGMKIILAFSVIIAVALVIGFVGNSGMGKIKQGTDALADRSLPSVSEIMTIHSAMGCVWIGERGLLIPIIYQDQTKREAQYAYMAKAFKQAEDARTKYKAIPKFTDEQKLWDAFIPMWDSWKKEHDAVITLIDQKTKLIESGVPATAPRVTEIDRKAVEQSLAAREQYLKTEAALLKVVAINQKVAAQTAKEAEQVAASSRAFLFSAMVIGFVLAAGLAIFFTMNVASILSSLLGETTRLAKACVNGQLSTRGDAAAINFEFRPIVEGFNQTLDAVIVPLNMSANYMDRIAKGDIPPKITDEYHGDFNAIKNNLNQCIDAVNGLVADVDGLVDAIVEGKLDTRADAAQHAGDYQKIIGGVNAAVEAFAGHLNQMPAPAMIIDTDYTVRYMNQVGADVIGLPKKEIIGAKCYNLFKTSDCHTANCACTRAMQEGRLVTSETDAHPGQHDLEISYTGAPVKNREGRIIGALELVTDQTAVKRAARVMQKQSDFQTRNVEQLVGNLSKIAGGDIAIDTALLASDEDTREIGESFRIINQALDETANAIRQLIEDARQLANEAVAGRLATRADAARHQGEFRNIVEGFNDTLDAVVKPIDEASAVLERLAQNDLTGRMVGDYQGDHAKIKNNLNTACDALESTIQSVLGIVKQVAESAEQLSLAAESVGKASQEVAGGAQQVASGTADQSRSATEAANSME
ncbi:MAG: MCP four helix bundle domain-containing protein, partial [Armatimonadota bacterium]